jgi:hypothetical protein
MAEHRHPKPTPHSPPNPPDTPPDICLLLRAHSERQWLSREVIPVIRQIETPAYLPAEQLSAATAYLEAIWIEALDRAHETDSELRHLDALRLDAKHLDPQPLVDRARRYHTSVRALREAVARRVALLLATPTPFFTR